jgi:hypothetical protein
MAPKEKPRGAEVDDLRRLRGRRKKPQNEAGKCYHLRVRAIHAGAGLEINLYDRSAVVRSRFDMLDVVYECREALLERSGQSGFQILRIQSCVRPGDRNDRDVDIREDVSGSPKNDGRTQQKNEDRENNERIRAIKS